MLSILGGKCKQVNSTGVAWARQKLRALERIEQINQIETVFIIVLLILSIINHMPSNIFYT